MRRDFEGSHSLGARICPEGEKKFRTHNWSVGRSGQLLETYAEVKVQWKFLCGAIDKAG
jgi:transposase-like protein